MNRAIIYFLLMSICIVAACSPQSSKEETALAQENAVRVNSPAVFPQDTPVSASIVNQTDSISDHATFWIVIADTNLSYTFLRKKMFILHQKLNLGIDTLGRYYNEAKNLIALPDNAEDDMYAGDYFPRRFPSINLSLEYLDFYKRPAGDNTIALVTGIYEKQESADSALMFLKKAEAKSFSIKAEIYIGCMH